MSALLAALRISRRGIGRARARSALIIVMIGLPVLAVTAVLTYSATEDLRPEERLTMDLGMADARLVDTGATEPIRQNVSGDQWEPGVEKPREPRSQAEIQALAGPGSRAVPVRSYHGRFWLGASYDETLTYEVDLRDPVTTGMFPLVEGRYPQAADEVVVTRSMEMAVGATLRSTGDGLSKRVVGTVVERPVEFGRLVIGLPGSLLPGSVGRNAETSWLVDTPAPVTWEQTLRLNQAGVAVRSRAVLENPPPEARQVLPAMERPLSSGDALAAVLGVTLAIIEVVLLAGPAFAVGLRRRRRELALIAAQGGSGRHLKLVVLADGLILGLTAAVLGAVLGVGAARGIVAYVGIWPTSRLGSFDVPVGQIALVAALGVFSGVAAAVVPAVQAARVNVVAALAGRRPAVRDRAGWPLLGLVLLVAGTGTMLLGIRAPNAVILSGAVLGLLGLVMVTPWLVRLTGGPAGRLPLPFRLAARDAARNRGRTAPAIVAVLAAAAAFSTVAVSLASSEKTDERYYRAFHPTDTTMIYGRDVTEEGWQKIRPIVAETIPGVPLLESYLPVTASGERVSLQLAADLHNGYMTGLGGLESLPAGGPGLLRYLLGRTDRVAEAALAEGKAVIFNPKAVLDGGIRITVWTPSERVITVPAVVATVQGPSRVLGVLPLAALTKAGFIPGLSHLLVDPAAARLSPEQEQRLSGQVRAVTPNVTVVNRRGTSVGDDRAGLVLWIMAAFASVVVLGSTLTAAGLAATDARPDLDTLSAVGARPGTRRLVAAGQAVVIAGLGVPLGLLIGLLPGLVLARRANSGPEIGINGVPFEQAGAVLSVPWPTLVAVGVGLPLVVALIAMASARTRVTLTRRLG